MAILNLKYKYIWQNTFDRFGLVSRDKKRLFKQRELLFF